MNSSTFALILIVGLFVEGINGRPPGSEDCTSDGKGTTTCHSRYKRGLIGSAIGGAATGVGLLTHGLWAGAKGIGTGIGTGLSLVGNGLSATTHGINAGLGIASNAIDQTSEGLSQAGNAVISGASNLVSGAGQAVRTVGDIAQGEVDDAASALREGLINPEGTPKPSSWWG